jgi:nucleotide-binding universal stress UspA family protein
MVHYLVAVDNSEAAMRALQKALQLMSKESDRITALHALEFPVV